MEGYRKKLMDLMYFSNVPYPMYSTSKGAVHGIQLDFNSKRGRLTE
jgi:hypothetical protein